MHQSKRMQAWLNAVDAKPSERDSRRASVLRADSHYRILKVSAVYAIHSDANDTCKLTL
jgi:hypothetical protein